MKNVKQYELLKTQANFLTEEKKFLKVLKPK